MPIAGRWSGWRPSSIATRYLVWNKEADGAVVLKGRLGRVEGEKLVGALRALGARHRKTAALAGQELTRAQSAADALGVLVDHHTGCQKLPKRGADRPRILVQLDYDTLIGKLGTATLLNTAELLSAQQARVLACDAEIFDEPLIAGFDLGTDDQRHPGERRDLGAISRHQSNRRSRVKPGMTMHYPVPEEPSRGTPFETHNFASSVVFLRTHEGVTKASS